MIVAAVYMYTSYPYLLLSLCHACIPYPHPSPNYTATSDNPELKVLLRELRRVANEWEDIGIELDIEEGQLRQINTDKGGECKSCLREMLRVWLSRVAPPPSWSAIADALDTLGHEDIATHLRSQYCPQQPQQTTTMS